MHIFISMDDIFGEAIRDYHSTRKAEHFLIHNYYGDPEVMPVEAYFRSEPHLSEQERFALSLAKGKVLEIGAGAGALSLILKDRGFDVTSIEISPLCVEVMKARGLKKVENCDFYYFSTPQKFDSIYLLMNGLGISGTLSRLRILFERMAGLLADNGQIIFDSSNVDYVYEKLPKESYYGEIEYCNEYRGRRGEWFKWLYVDFLTMEEEA